MRKLPDWLQQDEALAASSKSHQYLQMNINSLRRLLGKMKQTTPAFKAKSSSWMRLVYFVCLAILITLSHSTIQLWILAIFLLAHIAFLPGEALLRLWKVLTRVLIFTAIVLLPSILLRGFQNSGIFLGRTGILALGANIFNMAIAMPFVGYAVYHFFRKQNHETAGVLVGSYVGINVAAFLTAIELGIQPIIATQGGEPLYNPYGLAVTIPAMMVTHLTIAGAVEVFFTYVIYRFVKQVAPQELYTPTSVNTTSFVKKIRYVLIALVVLSPLGLLAEGTAFGEWSADELAEMMNNVPAGIENGFSFEALFSDYTIPGTNIAVGYILSAITALLIFYILGKMIRTMNGAKASHA